MGFLDKMKGLVFETEEPATNIDPSQPLKGQIDGVGTQHANVLAAQPIYAGQPTWGQQPAYQPTLSEADRTKWNDYFSKLFVSLDDPRPSYHEFIAMTDAMGNTLADDKKFPMIFKGFQMQGLTKDVLLQTAQTTLDAIKADAVKFSQAIEKKLADNVTIKRSTAQEKALLIAKLTEEISQLNIEAQAEEAKIQTNSVAYNMFSADMINKISRDIEGIKNNIVI